MLLSSGSQPIPTEIGSRVETWCGCNVVQASECHSWGEPAGKAQAHQSACASAMLVGVIPFRPRSPCRSQKAWRRTCGPDAAAVPESNAFCYAEACCWF